MRVREHGCVLLAVAVLIGWVVAGCGDSGSMSSDDADDECADGEFSDNGTCTPCSSGCAAGEYESTACSATADRQCAACTAIAGCADGEVTCTSASDSTCASCAVGYFADGDGCAACSGACATGEYQSAACSATADRQCAACDAIANCSQVTCTGPDDETCAACDAGSFDDGGECVPCRVCEPGEYQVTDCGADTDRTCATCAAITNCNSVTCTTATDQTCAECADGYFADGAACTTCAPVTDPNCEAVTCSTATDQECVACAAGYSLRGGSCLLPDELVIVQSGLVGVVEYGPRNRGPQDATGTTDLPEGNCAQASCTVTPTTSTDQTLSVRVRAPVVDGTSFAYEGCDDISRRRGNCYVELPAKVVVHRAVGTVTLTVNGEASGTFEWLRRTPNSRDGAAEGTFGPTGGTTTVTGTYRGIRIRYSDRANKYVAWSGCDEQEGNQCYVTSFPANITAEVASDPVVTLNVQGITTETFEYMPAEPGNRGDDVTGTITGTGATITAVKDHHGVRIKPPPGLAVHWTGCDRVGNRHNHCYVRVFPATVTATVSQARVTLSVTGDTSGTFDIVPRDAASAFHPTPYNCSGAGCIALPVVTGPRGMRVRPPNGAEVDWTTCQRVERNDCYLTWDSFDETGLATIAAEVLSMAAPSTLNLTVAGDQSGTFTVVPRMTSNSGLGGPTAPVDPNFASVSATVSGAGATVAVFPADRGCGSDGCGWVRVRAPDSTSVSWTGCDKISNNGLWCYLDYSTPGTKDVTATVLVIP